jgi:diguanylate cyclase (GGDEF)-like protein/PAS domain S-box-containing protein
MRATGTRAGGNDERWPALEPTLDVLGRLEGHVMCLTTAEGEVLYVTPSIESTLGYRREEFVGVPDVVHPEDRPAARAAWRQLLTTPGASTELCFRLHHADRTWRWVEAFAVNALDQPGFEAVVWNWRDVTERVEAERSLQHLLAMVEATPDLVATVAPDGRIRYLNAAGREFLGLGLDEDLADLSYSDHLPPTALEAFRRQVLRELQVDGTWSGELDVIRPDGARVQVLARFMAHRDEDGVIEFYSANLREITELKAVEAELAYLATHDPLTRLPNRTLLVDRLEQALRRAERDRRTVAVLFCDLDDFKMVNDRHGHATGDEVLAVVAQRLRQVVRPGDTVARYGGDEFVVICDALADRADTGPVCNRIHAAVLEPVVVGDLRVQLRVSIGIAQSSPGSTSGDLLARADREMYRAKHPV